MFGMQQSENFKKINRTKTGRVKLLWLIYENSNFPNLSGLELSDEKSESIA